MRFAGPSTVLLAEVMTSERETEMGKLAHKATEEAREILEKETDESGNPLKIVRVPLPPQMTIKCRPGEPLYSVLKQFRFRQRIATEMIEKGETVNIIAAASYINFLVTNGVVLIAEYWRPGRSEHFKVSDDAAAESIGSVFPGRKVTRVDVEVLNFLGGGMNCISQQQPTLE